MNDFQESEKVFSLFELFPQFHLNDAFVTGAFADVGGRGKSSNRPPLFHESGPGAFQQQVLAPGLLVKPFGFRAQGQE